MSKVENEKVAEEKEVNSIEDVCQANADAHSKALGEDTKQSFHDFLLQGAINENKERLFETARKQMMQMLINRKALVRQMEALDEQCSAIDAKMEALTNAIESGRIISSNEVKIFLDGGDLSGLHGVEIGVVMLDLETAGFDVGRLQPVKRKIHPRM